ncbi:HAMP domain-containing histidine kinase [Pseudoxanthomonas winnipegensis]|uniref:sensor histidine kinase n=1 Tax=Pseudoxanthomonas winnipegensis TaxID=2480810 RepID=UPI0025762433|nr:HAMP domain-containing sensor histidine kinase [Pseudoxanthomonas winnipegensis]WJI16596.1 HAMP domain-containing histidine kinase [Pseudoxanthomonas winnipegensis]
MASVTASPLPKPEGHASARPAATRARKFRRRLRTRIVWSFALLGLCLTVLFAYASILARQRVENQLVEDVMNRNMEASWRSYVASGGRNLDIPVQQMKGFVYRPDKLDSLRRDFPEWEKLDDGIHPMSGTDPDGKPFAYKVGVRKTPNAWFFIAYDMGQVALGEVQFKRTLYATVLLFTLVSLLIGWWAASRVMSPVSELANRLRAYRGSSNPTQLGPLFPEDEVGELARALDDYSNRLTEVVQRDREFNADVSHELRTPLAVIRGATELLLGKPDLEPKIQARLLRIQRAEQACSDLIGSLLLLSRNERGQGTSNVAKVADQLLDSHRAQIGGKPLELMLEGNQDLVIDAPEAALSVALGNLVGNAVKYTQEGTVRVRVLNDAVEVIDSGPGLSEEDAARLFDRGYRGTHAGHSQGGGIGLSIVSRLCDLYGWQVSVRPGAERGVVATLRFHPA